MTGAENTLIELWGAPGVIIIMLSVAVAVQYRTLQQMISKYENLLETVLKAQYEQQATLDKLVDEMSVRQYVTDLIRLQGTQGND